MWPFSTVRPARLTQRSGIAAIVGTVSWALSPWIQLATFGTRPYVATAFDVSALVGWLLMGAGLVGAWRCYGERLGRVGRSGLGLVAIGMTLLAGLYVRRVIVFVKAGLRPVPATGEDPAGLVLTWGFLLGLGLALLGTGLLGVGLRRLDRRDSLTSGALVAAPLVVALLVGLEIGALLPVPIAKAVVRTNLALVPFAFGWIALGRSVYTSSRR